MKYKLIIDKHAEESVTVTVHAPSSLTEQLENLVCSFSGADSVMGYMDDEMRKLEFRDIGIILWKEIRTALMCGIALAVVCFAKIWLIDHLLMGNDNITLMVDLVVCLALAVTVVMAKMVGCMLPMAAKAIHLDPAVMASPFISTIVDALSLLVYFMFAKMLLHI